MCDSFILLTPQHRSAWMFISVLNHNSYEMLQVSPPSQNTDKCVSFWFESCVGDLENRGKQKHLSRALNTRSLDPEDVKAFQQDALIISYTWLVHPLLQYESDLSKRKIWSCHCVARKPASDSLKCFSAIFSSSLPEKWLSLNTSMAKTLGEHLCVCVCVCRDWVNLHLQGGQKHT